MSPRESGLSSLRLDLEAPGWCVHLPTSCDYEAFAKVLESACRTAGKSLAVASLPRPAFSLRLLRRPTVCEWLATVAGIPLSDAEQIVAGLPVPVAPHYQSNAMNPRRFLALAAAITRGTDVLLYETSGMDPLGRAKIHAYARQRYPAGCLIHANWAPVTDFCANPGECVVMAG
jgi:hypothetical protein